MGVLWVFLLLSILHFMFTYNDKRAHHISVMYSFSILYGHFRLFEPLPGLEPGTYALRNNMKY